MKITSTKNVDVYVGCSAPRTDKEAKFVEWVKAHKDMSYSRLIQMISGVWFESIRPMFPEGEQGDITAARAAFLIPVDKEYDNAPVQGSPSPPPAQPQGAAGIPETRERTEDHED